VVRAWGLTISKPTCPDDAREIGVSSVLGQGSTFCSSFHLERRWHPKRAVAGLPQLAAPSAFWSSTIRELSANSRDHLKASQMMCFLRGSGAEAMTLLARNAAAGKAFDIAIIDIDISEWTSLLWPNRFRLIRH